MINKTNIIVFIAGAVLGLLSGFFIGKGIYDRPIETKVERDTVTRWDTIPHYYPKPVEVEKTRTEYKWLTRVEHFADTSKMIIHDSVLVEVPIESKHYHAQDYDAWVSGYNPSLDSIRTYNKTEYITETVTVTSNKRKPWGIGFSVGYGYDFNSKTASPYVGVGISYDIISF